MNSYCSHGQHATMRYHRPGQRNGESTHYCQKSVISSQIKTHRRHKISDINPTLERVRKNSVQHCSLGFKRERTTQIKHIINWK